MKTSKEVRARLADFETRFEAEAKAARALGPKAKDYEGCALNLEMLGSWAGALRWALGEEAER